MTSAHKIQLSNNHSHRAGFTLLEIMVTMAIISVILGSAVLYIATKDNGAVDQLAQQTQVLAKDTHRLAQQQERPYSIYISSEEIWVQPESIQLSEDEDFVPQQILKIPEGVRVALLTNPEEGWFSIDKNSQPFVWTFTQSGLCDAIEIEFENDDAIQTLAFHPLTAGEVIDED